MRPIRDPLVNKGTHVLQTIIPNTLELMQRDNHSTTRKSAILSTLKQETFKYCTKNYNTERRPPLHKDQDHITMDQYTIDIFKLLESESIITHQDAKELLKDILQGIELKKQIAGTGPQFRGALGMFSYITRITSLNAYKKELKELEKKMNPSTITVDGDPVTEKSEDASVVQGTLVATAEYPVDPHKGGARQQAAKLTP